MKTTIIYASKHGTVANITTSASEINWDTINVFINSLK